MDPTQESHQSSEAQQDEYGHPRYDNDIHVHDDELANGDPVTVFIEKQDGSKEAVSLGTGFETMDHLIKSLEHTISEGSSTTHIMQERADELHNAKQVHIFTLAADIDAE